MKLLTFLLAAVLSISCTVVNGNRNTAAYTYASVGGDARGIAQTPDGYTAEALTTSDSFREGTKALRWAIVAAATQGIASDLSGAWRSVAKAKEATKATSIRSAADVEKAKLATDLQKTAIATQPVISQ